MLNLFSFIFLFTSLVYSIDYFTIELLKTDSKTKADEITIKYKNMGFDAFTQTKPKGYTNEYLSCINKFKTREDALIFARNLKNLKYYDSFEISLVLSRQEWIAKLKKEKEIKRIPASKEKIKVNIETNNLPKRTPASIEPYTPNSFEGKPLHPPLENPIIKGQKFVSTENGLYVSTPVNNQDYWKLIPTEFNTKNAYLYFQKDGTLYINNFKLDPEQKSFNEILSFNKYHLSGFQVEKIYEKDGLLWIKCIKNNPNTSTDNTTVSRIFISADNGSEWSELPEIIKKDI